MKAHRLIFSYGKSSELYVKIKLRPEYWKLIQDLATLLDNMASSGPVEFARFDPWKKYLATCVRTLDNHSIRVQGVEVTQASINTNFTLESGAKVTAIRWLSEGGNLILGVGLSRGAIILYSPWMNQTIAVLDTPSQLAVEDLHYSKLTTSLWSCDNGGNIFEWNLETFVLKQAISLNELLEASENISRIATIKHNGIPHLLVGSSSVYLISISQRQVIKTFPGHVRSVNSILPASPDSDLFFTSALGDEFVNLYSTSSMSNTAAFVAQSSVTEIEFSKTNSSSVLVMTTEMGDIEVFNNPLKEEAKISLDDASSKKKRKQASSVKTRSSDAVLKMALPESQTKTSVGDNLNPNAVTVADDYILFSWLENMHIQCFETVRWLSDLGDLTLQGVVTIEKSSPNLRRPEHSLRGHDIAAPVHYNEANAIVTEGGNLKDVANDTDDENNEESLVEKLERISTDKHQKQQKKKLKTTSDNVPTLAVVLSQSLRNNDHSLLESVLANRDPTIIESTISRLEPTLAVVLLERLTERLARHTTKFDQLNYWLKWILIIHGGFLSSLPNLNVQLSGLHATLLKKADALPRLLELQGRINILYQQSEIKKGILANTNEDIDSEESDNEYIEELDDVEFLENGGDEEMLDPEEGSEEYLVDEPILEGRSESFLEATSEGEEGYSDNEAVANGEKVDSLQKI